ncbi:hypothetical protein FRC02_001498 [Tulasnella sp. 418]|nr:hypothetical protein FRC02_001498 [Tulasnella sp. 418]
MGRTRQVTTYGRKRKNFICPTDKDFIPSSSKRSSLALMQVDVSSPARQSPINVRVASLRTENNPVTSGSPTQRTSDQKRKSVRASIKHSGASLPTSDSKAAQKKEKGSSAPSRKPLATKFDETAGSLSPMVEKSKLKKITKSGLVYKPQTVEIIVVDESGTEESREERRRTIVERSPARRGIAGPSNARNAVRPHHRGSKDAPIVLESDDSSEVILTQRKLTKARRPLVIDSSEDEDEGIQSTNNNILDELKTTLGPSSSIYTAKNRPDPPPASSSSHISPVSPPHTQENNVPSRHRSSKSSLGQKEPCKNGSEDYLTQLSAVMATLPPHIVTSVALSGNLEPALRYLSPQTRARLMDLKPSSKGGVTNTECLDMVEDMSLLSLDSSFHYEGEEVVEDSAEAIHLEGVKTPPRVESHPSIIRLLSHTLQTNVLDFTSFLETFPLDEVHANGVENRSLRKIGEASFSEVFALGQVVIKVVPLILNDGISTGSALPYASAVEDVEKEILITREMGAAHSGFIKLLKVFVVAGSYPPTLLDLWDEYDASKGSENPRPDVFPSSTHYALIILPHRGTDLESFIFSPRTEWKECVSVFWQVTRALAVAEESHRFEHRDLHWGQILIQEDASQSSGIMATIIDFGLSRMDTMDGQVYSTELDDTIFEGQGDYQFDIYRMMKVHNNGAWEPFRPLTNVMEM